MSVRVVETRPGDRIVVVNGNLLLKFIGWVEAHRPPGEWEPGFLGRLLNAMETAGEGDALGAAVTCAACGQQHEIRALYDSECGGWFCADDDKCNEHRMAAGEAESLAGVAS